MVPRRADLGVVVFTLCWSRDERRERHQLLSCRRVRLVGRPGMHGDVGVISTRLGSASNRRTFVEHLGLVVRETSCSTTRELELVRVGENLSSTSRSISVFGPN